MTAQRDVFLGLAGTALILVAWEVAVRGGFIDVQIFPSPSTAIIEAAGRLTLERVGENMVWSLYRVFVGFLLGTIAGVVVGVIAGWSPPVRIIAQPIIEILRPIPPLAWIPLAIIWFGLGEPSKFFIIFLAAFFPVVTSAEQGVRSVDPVLVRAARTFGLSGWRLLLRVVIPAASPDLATGIRIAWGLSFGIVVAAELIAADKGLGYMIMNERNSGGSVSVIVVGILLIGLLNLGTDAILAAGIRRWIGRWYGKA